MRGKRLGNPETLPVEALRLLTHQHERALIDHLSRYPETLQNAARFREPSYDSLFERRRANCFIPITIVKYFYVRNSLRDARLIL